MAIGEDVELEQLQQREHCHARAAHPPAEAPAFWLNAFCRVSGHGQGDDGVTVRVWFNVRVGWGSWSDSRSGSRSDRSVSASGFIPGLGPGLGSVSGVRGQGRAFQGRRPRSTRQRTRLAPKRARRPPASAPPMPLAAVVRGCSARCILFGSRAASGDIVCVIGGLAAESQGF